MNPYLPRIYSNILRRHITCIKRPQNDLSIKIPSMYSNRHDPNDVAKAVRQAYCFIKKNLSSSAKKN